MILLLCMTGMAFAQDGKSAASDRRFDGTWAVTLVAPDHTDANGVTALGFTYNFKALVKEGALHGEYSQKAKPPWLSIDGKIGPDGTALLTANGITGKPAYSLHNVAAGTPYLYHVKAHFEGSKGIGARVEGREGNFTFVKQ